MNKPTIKKKLAKKVKHWLDSIKDESIRKIAEESVFVTGGSITSMLLNEPVNDYDIYFTNYEACKAVANYYISIANEQLTGPKIYIDETKTDRVYIHVPNYEDTFTNLTNNSQYQPLYFSDNAITLSNDVQLVTRFYGNVEVIHENFDFAHCKCSYEYASDNLTLPYSALEAIITKTLTYTGNKYPLSSIIRTRKFIKRGWNINAGEYLKMAFQLNELDLQDIEVLRDQLVGVDMDYFRIIIEELSHNEEITYTVLMRIVDKVFNE